MTTTRAAIYLRQSRKYGESVSIEIQEINCRKLADREGWTVTAVFNEGTVGGGSTKGRDALGELRQAHQRGEFDIAIADDLDRFARNVADSSIIRAEMPTATWKEGIQNNELYADIQSAFGADYLRRISARWNDALMLRVKNGLPSSGSKQYGYDRVTSKGEKITPTNPKPKGQMERYVLNDVEAPILKEAYSRYTKGEGARTICEDFNARNLPAAGPAGWHAPGFFDLLDKAFYAGTIVFGGQESPGSHEPILTAAEWAAFRKAREAKKTGAKPRNPTWMLQGLVECGACGGKMLSHMARGVPNLMCATYNAKGKAACPGIFRKRSKVQQAVWWWLGAHLDEWASAMPTNEEGKLAADKAVADAEAVLESARETYDRYQTFAFENGIRPELSKAKLDEYSTAIDQAQAVVNEAQAELGSFTPASDVHEQISNGALLMGFEADPDAEPSEAATAQFRETLSKIIEKVIVHPATGTSPRDPNRDHRAEVEVVPR